MGIPQDGNRWMDDRDEDMPKIWLEDLTEEQYEAHKEAQRLRREQHRNSTHGSTRGL